MLSFQEMVAVIDRHTTFPGYGMKPCINIVKIRDELEYQWAFDELQVTRIIMDMRDKGLLV